MQTKTRRFCLGLQRSASALKLWGVLKRGVRQMFVKALQSWSHHTELEPIHGGHSINKEELSLVAAWVQVYI